VITFVGFGFMFLFWASSHRCFVLASRIRPFGHTLLLAFFYRPAPWSRAPSPFWPSDSDFRLCLGSVEARPEFCLLTGFSFKLLMIFLRSLARQPRFFGRDLFPLTNRDGNRSGLGWIEQLPIHQ
jgi:hypothetical protein